MPPFWNDLQSILPASHPKLAPLPKVGGPAPLPPRLPLTRYDQPTIIAFLRHCGCPFAEQELRELARLAKDDHELQVVIAVMSEEEVAREWFDAVGADFGDPSRPLLIADSTRELYATFGVGTLPFTGLFGTAVLGPLKQLASQGITNRATSMGSNRWQTAGAFAVARGGEVKWVHVAEHAGHMASFEEAVQSLR